MSDVPAAPAAAGAVFGERLELAERYAGLLATSGIERGLIGPREAPRLWHRHLLNCAVVQELVPEGVHVLDVGSGAGLPGLPLAIARPDLRVELVEPLLRRTSWLEEVVADLGLLEQVSVTRGKAAMIGKRRAQIVTSRAVAPLERLLPMCAPLLAVGGRVLAMKGDTAADEVATVRPLCMAWGLEDLDVARCGRDVLGEATTVVTARRVHRGG